MAGWSEPNLFGKRAIERGDVQGLLIALEVWHYAAQALAEVPGVTIARVLSEARLVEQDRDARNKPLCLAKRLARAFGVELPQVPGSKRLSTEQMAGPLGSITKLRLDRARRDFSTRFEDGRGMTAAEYARSEDE